MAVNFCSRKATDDAQKQIPSTQWSAEQRSNYPGCLLLKFVYLNQSLYIRRGALFALNKYFQRKLHFNENKTFPSIFFDLNEGSWKPLELH